MRKDHEHCKLSDASLSIYIYVIKNITIIGYYILWAYQDDFCTENETHTFVPHVMFPFTCLACPVNILPRFGLPGFVGQVERSPRAAALQRFLQ